jgi:hypothetical protein
VLGKEDVFVSLGAHHEGVMQRRELNAPDGTCPFKTM